MDITLVGIDISKHIFQFHGGNVHGRVVLRRKLRREQVLVFMSKLASCTVVMEACGGAHYWGREFTKLGHRVKLIAPQFVKPFIKSNKNDRNDAEAIYEAALRPSMRFVLVKREEQQDLQNLHRVRERLVSSRTALVNEIRGLLMEYGIILPQGIRSVRNHLPILLEKQAEWLSALCIDTFRHLYEELVAIDERIRFYEVRIEELHRSSEVSKRLASVPGVGVLTASAICAAIDPRSFKNGRQLAAWIGLVPRQHSTGGKPTLLGISKRGDRYLRTLLIHGARAVLRHSRKKTDSHSRWIQRLLERKGHNRTVVALANKNARVLWALMQHEMRFKPELAAA